MAESRASDGKRAAARATWPIRVVPLSPTPDDDLSHTTTASERLAMMWDLALDAWTMTGSPLPTYEREDAPIRIVSLHEA